VLYPWLDIGLAVVKTIPQFVFSPSNSLFFWILVGITAMQYGRIHDLERRIYGAAKSTVFQRTLLAFASGAVAGITGSLVMAVVGVSLEGTGIGYVLLVAVVLMLVHPRFVCFAYAGGLVALTSLVVGWPQVNIPGLMGLVAVLHIIESLLIWMSGAAHATPLYVRDRFNRVVGGFSLQKFWPLPLAVLFLIAVPHRELLEGLIEMPEWWPLIRPVAELADRPDVVYTLLPVAAILGYGDLALTVPPKVRVRKSALYLMLYSVSLLALAVVASRSAPFWWVAALFAPLGHEWVVRVGMGREQHGRPYFVPPERGVRLLDVMPCSPAAGLGLGSGDVILTVNDRLVNGREELRHALLDASFYLELSVRRPDGSEFVARTDHYMGGQTPLGIIPVPEPGDESHVELGRLSPMGRLDRAWRALKDLWRR